MEAKQTVRDLLDRLPDNCRLDEVSYHLYVLHEIEQGRSDARDGRTLTHQQVAQELRTKFGGQVAFERFGL